MTEADWEARAALPDPCTFLFGVPAELPDEPGLLAQHWVHCAQRHGHHGTALENGQVQLDGLLYDVKRGPRKRRLTFEGRAFTFTDTAWLEPVLPAEDAECGCGWRVAGPPGVLREAGTSEEDGVLTVGASEGEDGHRGFLLLFSDDAEEDEPYCLTLEPDHGVYYGGIASYSLTSDALGMVLEPDAAQALNVPELLEFQLELAPAEVELLREAFARTQAQTQEGAR